jgi:glucose/arabinose dehydrogenase
MICSMISRRLSFLAATFLIAAAPSVRAEQTKAPPPAETVPVKVDTITRGLVHPWGLAFLPDGRMLVTERPGRLRMVDRNGKLSLPIAGVPKVAAGGQGGLLDIMPDPRFPETGMVYMTFSEPRDGGRNATAVARARLVLDEAAGGGRLEDVKVIFQQQPAWSSSAHFGSRIAFARDGSMFVTLGDRYVARDHAQDPSSHLGKVVRLSADGTAYPGNPNLRGWAPEVWSIGHRNPQSAAIHPVTGKLWIVEHAARGGDEINVPESGKNYGWPVITYGRDYSGAKIGVGTFKEGMEQPIYYWDPSIAPSGMAFYTSDLVPQWKGNLFVGSLVLTHLNRLVLDGERVVGEERLLTNLDERIRDVRQGPDGALWLLTDSQEGRVLRVTAAAAAR